MSYGRLDDLKQTLYKTYNGRRLWTELNFAAETARAEGLSDEAVKKAVALLTEAPSDGLRDEIEALIAPLCKKCRAKQILNIAHAHIDMNWMWGYDETVAITLATFRTTLDLMKEYPDFTFGQSQASCYRIVEQHAPEMLEEIRERVREGRWALTASAWVECDKNMPETESLVMQSVAAKTYISKLFGVPLSSLDVGFEPDTFGHSAFLPEILTNVGIRYYYHCRGDVEEHIYRWRAPSGKEVLVYREPLWYNTSLQWADFRSDVCNAPAFSKKYGLETLLRVYGIGDHGGGVTRAELNIIEEMKTYPLLPAIRYGTYRDFFSYLDGIRETFPVKCGELNFFDDGCYTSQSRIKRAVRATERKLYEAQVFGSLAKLACGLEPRPLDEAWRHLLFTQFHDILTGSCVTETREHALGILQTAAADTCAETTRSLLALSKALSDKTRASAPAVLDHAQGAGAGYKVTEGAAFAASFSGGDVRYFTIFNSLPYAREVVAEIPVFDFPIDLDRLEVFTKEGNIAHQLLDRYPVDYWLHKYFRVLVKVPLEPFGYIGVGMRENKELFLPYRPVENPRKQEPMRFTLENEHLFVELDPITLNVSCITEKATGKKLCPDAYFSLVQEDRTQGATAWVVGRQVSAEPITENIIFVPGSYEQGALQSSLRLRTRFGTGSELEVRIVLDGRAVKYEVHTVWREECEGDLLPALDFSMRSSGSGADFDVPGGAVRREAQLLSVPALSYAAANVDGSSCLLVSRDSYGFRHEGGRMHHLMVRSTIDPDRYHEYGVVDFVLALIPFAGEGNAERKRLALEALYPASYVTCAGPVSHGAPLSVQTGTAVVTALKSVPAGILLRAFEAEGKETHLKIALPEGYAVFETDAFGTERGKKIKTPKLCAFELRNFLICRI